MRTSLLLVLTACASAPTSGALTVLTYNVQGLPDPLTESERPGVERMAAIAPLLEPFDIVALQEDFIAENHAILTDTTHPERAWFSAKIEDSRAYGAGLSLLARPSRTESAELHYAACHGLLDAASDCLASKGLQRMTLDLGGVQVDVLNTHHEAGGGPEDIAARESQVAQVIDAMAQRPGVPVIFLGDMNLRPSRERDAAGLALYAAAGLRHACDEVGCDEPDHIDQIYVRDGDGLSLRVTSWRNDDPIFTFAEGDPMSDHPPIVAGIAWETDGR